MEETMKLYGNDFEDFGSKSEIDDELLSGRSETKTAERQIWSLVLNQQNLLICHGNKRTEQIGHLLHVLPVYFKTSATSNDRPSVLMLSGLDNCYDIFSNNLKDRPCSLSRNSKEPADILFFYTSEEVPKLSAASNVRLVVIVGLDEALAKGHYGVINGLLSTLQSPVQFLLLASSIDIMVRIFIEAQLVTNNYSYLKLVMCNTEQTESALRKAKHQIIVCKKFDKIAKLTELLKSITGKPEPNNVLVFVSPDDIDDVHSYLLDKEYPVLKIERENPPEMVEIIWNEFSAFVSTKILVTHSSASILQKRSPIQHVIVHDFPCDKTTCEVDFLFQISLAGYSENGQSYLLYSEKDLPRAQELIDIKNELKQPIEPELYAIADKQFAAQSVPRRRLTLFEMLPEVSEEIEVKLENVVDATNSNEMKVKQYVEVVQAQNKQTLLQRVITKYRLHTKNKQNARKLVIFAHNNKIKQLITVINSSTTDKSSVAVAIFDTCSLEQRKKILEKVHSTDKQILVMSSALIEKLDIGVDNFELIVNVDFPQTMDRYRHQISNMKSSATRVSVVNFFSPENSKLQSSLVKFLKETGQVINPLLLSKSKTTKKPDPTEGNLAELFTTWDEDKPAQLTVKTPESSTFVIPSKFQQIPQYVEILAKDKENQFLNLMKFLLHQKPMPKLNMVVFISSAKICQLQEMLQNRLVTYKSDLKLHDLTQQSNEQRRKMINSNAQGIFFTPISILEEQIIEDIQRVNFVVHFNFPKYADSYLKSLRLIKGNGYAITFFVPQNFLSLKSFDEAFRKMNQPVNPLLDKIADKTTVKKIQNILDNETSVKLGNIAAFMDYTKSSAYLEIRSALQVVQSIDYTNMHQFVEVMAEEKMKSHKLSEILDAITAQKQLQKFKMLIFAKSERLTFLSKLLTERYKFPIFQVSMEYGGQILAQIVKAFRHGVLLIETGAFETLQQTTTFDMSNVNFTMSYDFSLKNYVQALSKLQPNVDSFSVAFLTPKNSDDVGQLICVLRETKQKINPLLFAMQQNAPLLFEYKLSPKQMKTGNILGFISFLNNNQNLKCPEEITYSETRKKQKKSETETSIIIDLTNQEDVVVTPDRDIEIIEPKPVVQFVEVLADDEKPDALMHVLNHLFCDGKKYAKSKVLLFATLPHIDMLYKYLNTNGKQKNKHFPQIFTIPDGATAAVRERILGLFMHGILLISPYNFTDTGHQTRIGGVRCVVNYDLPRAKTAVQKTSPNSTENLDGMEEIYLKRIANVNLLENSCALTFLTHNDLPVVDTLIRVLMANDQKVNPLLVYMDSLEAANRQKHVVSLNDPETMKKIQENTRDVRNHLSVGNMAAMYAYMNVKVSSVSNDFGSKTLTDDSPGPSRNSQQIEQLPKKAASSISPANEGIEQPGRQFVEFMLDKDRGMTLLNLLHHIHVRDNRNNMKILIFCDRSKISDLTEFILGNIENSLDREKFPVILAITGFEDFATWDLILKRFRSQASQDNQLLIVFDEFFVDRRSDFPMVNLVINFDFPMVGHNSSMVYQNRISSLSLAGNSITFFTPRSIDYLKVLISDFCQMKQVINPTLRAIQSANNYQEQQLRIQNALDVRQSISVGNIEDFLNYLKSQRTLEKPRKLSQKLFTEVLPESDKPSSLVDLLRYIFKSGIYKNLKILMFVGVLTIEKIKEIDDFLHNEMLRVMDQYPNFNRYYAHRNSDVNVILRNTTKFTTSCNSFLITDVDAKTLGVRNTDFLIFYDCVNRMDKQCEFYELLGPANLSYTVSVSLFTPNDRFLANDFQLMCQRYEQPINPLVVKLNEANISDGYLRTLRRSIKVGNLTALYQSCENALKPAAFVESKIPKSISKLLERYVNKHLQTSIIPSMFSDADLIAITRNSDETTMALLIAAVGLTMQETGQTSEPHILIFTRTLETVKKMEALIRMFNGILQKDGIHIDLCSRIIVGLVGHFSDLHQDQRQRFRNCKFALFDQFDKLIRLGSIHGLYDIVNNRCHSNQLAIKVFSAEYSVYEKLLSLLYLKRDHHFYNAGSDEDASNNFSNVQQYFEMKNLGKDRKQSLIEVLQQILNVDISDAYTIVIFFNDNDAALQIAYQNLVVDLPNIAQQVFCKQTFTNNFDNVLYWAKLKQQRHLIFLTNDARDLQNVKNVKYIINFDFPSGRFALLEYLQRMGHIKSKTGFAVSYFGFKDFIHSNVLIKLLEHMKQPINPLFLIIREKNLNHTTFAEELKSMSMSSSSIGDLTDFFMALCLMDHDDMDGDEDSFKRKSLENDKRDVKRPCRPEMNGRELNE